MVFPLQRTLPLRPPNPWSGLLARRHQLCGPYDALKRALKAEIDETAWAELNSTISRPFAKPKHGRICVKVINHFGEEVQKVFFV